jgi:hypothetical protein
MFWVCPFSKNQTQHHVFQVPDKDCSQPYVLVELWLHHSAAVAGKSLLRHVSEAKIRPSFVNIMTHETHLEHKMTGTAVPAPFDVWIGSDWGKAVKAVSTRNDTQPTSILQCIVTFAPLYIMYKKFSLKGLTGSALPTYIY